MGFFLPPPPVPPDQKKNEGFLAKNSDFGPNITVGS